MERKYYLRGLGIGIAVTAIIMGIAAPGKQTMTDAEVIARAKELGMVENTVLSETLQEEQTEEDDAGDEAAGQNAAEQNAEDANIAAGDGAAEQNDTGSTDAGETAAQQEDGADDGDEAGNEDAGTDLTGQSGEAAANIVVVDSGDGSYTVAKKLADAGIVASAEDFDTYLCQNGYDKKLRPGTFSIPADASEEQIARIITREE